MNDEPKKSLHEQELERYRLLLDQPTSFKDGFNWTTVAGIFFCGLVMMPGGIYLSLMTGQGLSAAASWVTVILFMEIARRAMQPLSRQNLVILLHASSIMMMGHVLFPGGPFGELVYRAYLAGSDAARDAGMLGAFPSWFCPKHDSQAILQRTFFHRDWLLPIGILLFVTIITFFQRYTLGYFFFRLCSDVEHLPFPLAPVQAQGAMALAEAEEKPEDDAPSLVADAQVERKKGERWRLFSLGAYIGIGFGVLQVGIPAVTGLFLSKPFYLIPQPFIDMTTVTEGLLPATPTGFALDLGSILIGFVLPFWTVMGTLGAVLLTVTLNPLLHHLDILHTWQPGMGAVNTTFANNVDFWMSFNIGAGLAIAAISVYSTIRDTLRRVRSLRAENKGKRAGRSRGVWDPPYPGRGDYPVWIAVSLYLVSAVLMISLCWWLLPRTPGVAFFLVFFAFLYNPLISYVNARLLGISGQQIQIPFVKESAFLLSGAKGVDIWLAPVPIYNFGQQAQSFRVNELTGVSFWSLIKTDIIATPVLFILSLVFWSFIWHSDAIPSETFPAAQINWELAAKNQVLVFSSTFVGVGDDGAQKKFSDTEFSKALHPYTIAGGFGGLILLYTGLAGLGLPVMFVYGMVRGFGSFPHTLIFEIVGAMIGRFYLQKKFGVKNFMRMAPTLLAGYFTGVGLIGMATIALRLVKSAISSAPF